MAKSTKTATPTNYSTELNTVKKGMNTDVHLINSNGQSYTYALNAVMESFDGENFIIQNESSSVLKIKFPEGFCPIGIKHIYEQYRVLYFLVNSSTGESLIAESMCNSYIDKTDRTIECSTNDGCHIKYNEENFPLEDLQQKELCKLDVVVKDKCFNFNKNYPVDIEYRITDCGVNLYFTDNFNDRRYLYLENENFDSSKPLKVKQEFYSTLENEFDDCGNNLYSDKIDCNKLNYNRCYEKPCICFNSVSTTGSLKEGVYQFFTSYSDKFGNELTNYSPATQNIPIYENKIKFNTNLETSKALTIDVKNLDKTSFSHFNLVVAETIDNFTEFKLVGTFPLTKNVDENFYRYTYTGNDSTLKKLDYNDIFFRRPFYDKAKSVTKANDTLFYAGLEEYEKLNLQQAANDVKLYWQTVALTEAVYSKERNNFSYRGYQRDEVYSFGIVFEYCDGYETPAFHIPGPSEQYFFNKYGLNVKTVVNNDDVIKQSDCAESRDEYWQVYNTGKVIESLSDRDDSNLKCEDASCWEAGDFAYWESEEYYPNDKEIWGNLCNKPIRHHKFPDSCVTHIHNNDCAIGTSFEVSNIVYPIGVKVDHVSVSNALNSIVAKGLITEEQKAKIHSYRIVRGNRSSDKSIVAKGLLYDVWQYEKDDKTLYYPNYPYNDLNNDHFISPTDKTYDEKKGISLINLPNQSKVTTDLQSKFEASGRYTFHSPDTHFFSPALGTILKLETVEYGKSEGYFTESLKQAEYKRLSFFARLLAFGIGIAAALSATTEKDCVTYTIKSNSKESGTNKQDAHKIKTRGRVKRNVPIISDTVLGQTVFTNRKKWFKVNTDDNVPEIEGSTKNETDYSTCIANKTFDKTTGKVITSDENEIMSSAASDVNACKDVDDTENKVIESYTRTTCTGKPYQLMSALSNNNLMKNVNKVLGGIGQGMSRLLLGSQEMNIAINTMKSLIPYKNYTIQYHSVGRYNNYVCVPNDLGFKQRNINNIEYLTPDRQTVNDTPNLTTVINNWHRESSVYIKYDDGVKFKFPHHINTTCVGDDNSRVTMDQLSLKDLDKKFNRDIASYYATIKNILPDQYGKVNSISYLETSSCSIKLDEELDCKDYLFGGDTFINRFALKRKLPFFIQDRFKFENDSDVKYSKLGNVGFPNYYIDTQNTLLEDLSSSSIVSFLNPVGLLDEIVGLEKSRLDAKTSKLFYQNGYVPLFSYGTPYFLVESDVNVDYRNAQDNKENDYYPHQTDLDFWYQKENVDIRHDNTYHYNKTYSKQNRESFIKTDTRTSEDLRSCKIKHPTRIIYSDLQYTKEDNFDNWLVFKANSFFDTSFTGGNIVSVDGIESDKVLVRAERQLSIFNAYNLIPTDQENIQVGTGGIFKSRPKEFSVTDLGYTGTQHKAIIHTEFGHVWVDAKRGNVFNLAPNAKGLDEISKNGKKNWFRENLPFHLLKAFPEMEDCILDNTFGLGGLILGYDRRFSRFLLTKKDYKLINTDVTFNKETNTFHLGDEIVSVKDRRYFCDASWTMSYNFYTKSWVSYHSYKPLYYNYYIDTFDSVYEEGVEEHLLTNKSYQVFKGKRHPFIIEFPTKASINNSYPVCIEYKLESIRYHNDCDTFYNCNINFNKAYIFNKKQNSGLLELVQKDENDLSQITNLPEFKFDRTKIKITNSENIWKLNDFYDLTHSHKNNIPVWLHNCAKDNKIINVDVINYYKPDCDKERLRAEVLNTRLINDMYSNYKLIFSFSKPEKIKSYR